MPWPRMVAARRPPRRRPPDPEQTTMTATVTAPRADEEPTAWYGLAADKACRRLDVDPAVGLSSAQVAERRARYGPNKLAEEAKEPGWKAFLRQYNDLMQLVLV